MVASAAGPNRVLRTISSLQPRQIGFVSMLSRRRVSSAEERLGWAAGPRDKRRLP